MKQWLAEYILSAEDLFQEKSLPIDRKEFTISLGMVTAALSLFGVVVRFLGT